MSCALMSSRSNVLDPGNTYKYFISLKRQKRLQKKRLQKKVAKEKVALEINNQKKSIYWTYTRVARKCSTSLFLMNESIARLHFLIVLRNSDFYEWTLRRNMNNKGTNLKLNNIIWHRNHWEKTMFRWLISMVVIIIYYNCCSTYVLLLHESH